MNLNDMRGSAAETLTFFMQAMPDVPFTESDIVFYFAEESKMASSAVELCSQYCPDKILNDSQLRQLGETIAANALIGKLKSAVLVRIDSDISEKDFRRIIVHELMHVFCSKLEVDGEHFIDIYGSGTTPDIEPDDKAYDGMIVAGYNVWSEFIAQYYAIKMIDGRTHEFTDIAETFTSLLHDVTIIDLELSKGSFYMMCAYWLNCMDFEETLSALDEPGAFIPIDEPYGEEAQKALFDCVNYLYAQMQKDKPWKINEDFIFGLGFKYTVFRVANSQYLGII